MPSGVGLVCGVQISLELARHPTPLPKRSAAPQLTPNFEQLPPAAPVPCRLILATHELKVGIQVEVMGPEFLCLRCCLCWFQASNRTGQVDVAPSTGKQASLLGI